MQISYTCMRMCVRIMRERDSEKNSILITKYILLFLIIYTYIYIYTHNWSRQLELSRIIPLLQRQRTI